MDQNNPPKETSPTPRVLGYALLIALFWVAAVSGSCWWSVSRQNAFMTELALSEARGSLHKDMIYRRWAVFHGGVYVPATNGIHSSPELSHVKERDLVTPSGRKLTLVSPSSITRQAYELGKEQDSPKTRINSLKPMRAENASDQWESQALKAFAKGASEYSSMESLNGTPHLRMMRPMYANESCLKCHSSGGIKQGDLLGGISVSIPMEPYLAVARKNVRNIFLGHLLVLVFGLITLVLGSRRFQAGAIRRMQKEEDFSRSEERFRTIFETARDYIFIKGPDLRYLQVNPVVEKFFGKPAGQIIGKNDHELFGREAGEHIKKVDLRVLQGEIVEIEDSRQVSGRSHCFHVIKVPTRNRAGQITGLCGIARDITERKTLELQLMQAQKMEAVGTLAGGIAHDFNELLLAIIGYTESALEEASNGRVSRPDLDQVMKAAGEAKTLVDRVLTFSRQSEASQEPLDLNRTIISMTGMLERSTPKDINFQLRLDPDLQTVQGDVGQLEQVLINLGNNARDAMPDGGTIIISTENMMVESKVCSACGVSFSGAHAVLSVSDTGQGITQEVFRQIFDPFFTTKDAGKGAGLGLSLIFGIAKNHGGHTVCESHEGRGTTFSVYLPVCALDEGEAASAPTGAQPGLSDIETILVVDDEESFLDISRKVLSRDGYDVITAGSCDVAMDIYRQNFAEIDLVILAMDMPVMRGDACLKNLLGINPAAKVLAASGQSEELDSDRIAGAVGFVGKPLKKQSLLDVVRAALDMKPEP